MSQHTSAIRLAAGTCDITGAVYIMGDKYRAIAVVGGTATINNASCELTNSTGVGDLQAIYVSSTDTSATITLRKGIAEVIDTNSNTSSVYVNGSAARFNLGNSSDTLSTTNPKVSCEDGKYSVRTNDSGKFYFYNGRLRYPGSVGAYNSINGRRSGYKVHDTGSACYLEAN